MKNLLINIGKKSKKAFLDQVKTKKKDKVLKDYLKLIGKYKKKIIYENNKDIKNAVNKNTKKNFEDEVNFKLEILDKDKLLQKNYNKLIDLKI